jgi:hypothetical protein
VSIKYSEEAEQKCQELYSNLTTAFKKTEIEDLEVVI